MTITLLLGAPLALVGAGGACTFAERASEPSPSCHQASPCPSDPPPTSGDVDMCEKALASRCKELYRALLDCVGQHTTCGADGRSNPEAVRDACVNEATAYTQCVPSPPDAAPYPDAATRD